MTPARTLALIALFLAFTIGSFVLYVARAQAAAPHAALHMTTQTGATS